MSRERQLKNLVNTGIGQSDSIHAASLLWSDF